MNRAADPVFHAIEDPTRRAILSRLRAGPRPVHQLAEGFAMSRPAVSKHLAVLKQAGLVTEARSGRENVYSLDLKRLALARDWLDSFWAGRLGTLKALAERTRP
jgi:DNA-binding transcriptional ArsR family regulator